MKEVDTRAEVEQLVLRMEEAGKDYELPWLSPEEIQAAKERLEDPQVRAEAAAHNERIQQVLGVNNGNC